MRHIEVSADDHRLLLVKLHQIGSEVILPRHTIAETAKVILRVRHIHSGEVVVLVFECDYSTLCVVVFDAYAVGDTQRLMSGIDSRTRIAFLLGIVPVAHIAG